ncbi:MAG: DEAD/DEAH box helicase [Bacteroidetes bacterium]|nr:DEAD/DEAH box helicase [Bacteroidota bacterium]
MNTFQNFNLSKQLKNALDDLKFTEPTPIQVQSFPVILSGRDMVGIAQTGTGKTLAYMLPLLQDLKFSEQMSPRILILVPTRELVVQMVENIKQFAKYKSFRIKGVFGGANINVQVQDLAEGADILVATPGRLFDLAASRVVKLKTINKFVMDEVDVLLDEGFRVQLNNILDMLPERRQNILFSATMTEEVSALIDDYFVNPVRIEIAPSGEPLTNIEQSCYEVKNFYTKVNLLTHLLADKNEYKKVLVFVSSKKMANQLFEILEEEMTRVGIIHANKEQAHRLEITRKFDEGTIRVLVGTDLIARGIDLEKLSHVINFDVPAFPENYIHRIGRTGRAKQSGKSIMFYTDKEDDYKRAIEKLMNYDIPEIDFPEEVEISYKVTPEEEVKMPIKRNRKMKVVTPTTGFQEKSEKNKKVNLGGAYKRSDAYKFKISQSRGGKKKKK